MRRRLFLCSVALRALLLAACGPAAEQTTAATPAPVAASSVCSEVRSVSAFACCGCVSDSAATAPSNRTCIDYMAGCASALDRVGKKVGAPCDPAAAPPAPTPWPTLPPPVPATMYVAFNTAEAPLSDVRLRQALALAIDREALLEAIGRDDRRPATSFVHPDIWPDGRYLYGQVGLPFDLERARSLFAAAGNPGPVALGCSENSQELARLIADQWAEHLGLEVTVAPMEWQAYLERLASDPPPVYLLGWMADYGPTPDFLDVFRSASPDNYARYTSAEYDALVGAAWIEADESARLDLCMAAERPLCEDDAVIAPVYYYKR